MKYKHVVVFIYKMSISMESRPMVNANIVTNVQLRPKQRDCCLWQLQLARYTWSQVCLFATSRMHKLMNCCWYYTERNARNEIHLQLLCATFRRLQRMRQRLICCSHQTDGQTGAWYTSVLYFDPCYWTRRYLQDSELMLMATERRSRWRSELYKTTASLRKTTIFELQLYAVHELKLTSPQ